jgi:hypothetical protein
MVQKDLSLVYLGSLMRYQVYRKPHHHLEKKQIIIQGPDRRVAIIFLEQDLLGQL